MYTLNRMGQKQMKCKKRSNKVVQNNVIKGSPQGSFIVLNTDYKMFFRLFVSEENESPLKCIDSYRNFWMFFIISQASSISRTNEYHRKSTPYYLLLWVIKDQSSLVLLFSDGCRRSRLRQSALYLV
jgi:hypothetical protein